MPAAMSVPTMCVPSPKVVGIAGTAGSEATATLGRLKSPELSQSFPLLFRLEPAARSR